MYKRMGFTIVELLVVIVVIAILATISVVSYTAIQDRAHSAATVSNIKTYLSGLEMLRTEQGKYWVDSSQSMDEVCIGSSKNQNEDCGTISYQGSGCSALGITPGTSTTSEIVYSQEFNEAMSQVLGSVPRGVQTKPSSLTQSIAGCNVTQTLRGAIYKSASVIHVSANTIGYGSNGGNNGAAYSIQYSVPGSDCLLPGARSSESIHPDLPHTSDGTICYLFGGNVTFSI